jgi:hypothetical protein
MGFVRHLDAASEVRAVEPGDGAPKQTGREASLVPLAVALAAPASDLGDDDALDATYLAGGLREITAHSGAP